MFMVWCCCCGCCISLKITTLASLNKFQSSAFSFIKYKYIIPQRAKYKLKFYVNYLYTSNIILITVFLSFFASYSLCSCPSFLISFLPLFPVTSIHFILFYFIIDTEDGEQKLYFARQGQYTTVAVANQSNNSNIINNNNNNSNTIGGGLIGVSSGNIVGGINNTTGVIGIRTSFNYTTNQFNLLNDNNLDLENYQILNQREPQQQHQQQPCVNYATINKDNQVSVN